MSSIIHLTHHWPCCIRVEPQIAKVLCQNLRELAIILEGRKKSSVVAMYSRDTGKN